MAIFAAMSSVLSGVRPTGYMHLGNYFGAVRNFVKLQDDYTCYFFVANIHALTTHPDPVALRDNTLSTLAEYLACGLDPDKCVIYLQGDVPEISELYAFLNMLAYKGELEKVATFKEKIKKHKENINAGLLTYPVLQAADILIHRAELVPVGKDQEQHLEMTRNFAKRFNHRYGADFFPEPQAFSFSGELVKVPGLDGSGKMGKSEGAGNAIYLREEEAALRKKVMRAVTDAGPTGPGKPMTEPIRNLFTLLELVAADSTVQHFREAWDRGDIRYGDLKKQLAEDLVAFTRPLREKIVDLENNKELLRRIAREGAEKARESARATIEGAKVLMGISGIW